MIKNLISFPVFSLLILMLSCTTSQETHQTAAAEATSEETQAVPIVDTESPDDRISQEVQEQHIQYIEAWEKTFKEREKTGQIASFPLNLKGLINAEAFFFEGKIQMVSWNDPAAGINALRSWIFEGERAKFSKIFDHGNNWYRYNYSFIDIDLGCIPYINMGELPKSRAGLISLDQKVVEFSCDNISQYTAHKLYHTAVLQHGMKEIFYEGKIAEKTGLHLRWEKIGEKIRGSYYNSDEIDEVDLAGYQLKDSIHLYEFQGEDTTGKWEGILAEDKSISGSWTNFKDGKKSPFSLQRSRVYTAANGEKTYQEIYTPPDFESSYLLFDDTEIPFEEVEYLKEYYGFTSTSVVLRGDNDYRAIYDYFEYAMTNTLVPESITRDEGFPDPEFNYFYFINLHQPDFVSEKERNDGYYSDLTDGFQKKNRMMAYLIKHIDRSPRSLEKLFSWYESSIYEALPDHLYEKMRLGVYFDELLSSYDSIQTYTNYEIKLEEVYHKLDSLDQARLNKVAGAYGRIEWEDRKECFRAFFDEKGFVDHIPKLDFWARRQHEGNARTVASILRRLKKGYEEGKGVDEGH
ncbi:MAG: hypothetical protein R8P61_13655 [Bacteroidia bacterium]|nr:hypothetical protein [Bacteroidia bacterium]